MYKNYLENLTKEFPVSLDVINSIIMYYISQGDKIPIEYNKIVGDVSGVVK